MGGESAAVARLACGAGSEVAGRGVGSKGGPAGCMRKFMSQLQVNYRVESTVDSAWSQGRCPCLYCTRGQRQNVRLSALLD
jgi:hypothetical protein